MWKKDGQQNTDGQKKGPESLGDILGRLFTSRGWGRKSERLQLEEAWTKASGEFADKTRVAGLRRGVLEVEVAAARCCKSWPRFTNAGCSKR